MGWLTMNSINFLRDFNAQVVPNFTPEGYELLQGFDVQIPEGTNTLAGRVKEFNTVTNDLAKETKWNKTMPWIVAAIEISLIAATVLGFVFGGPLGIIPIVALCIFEAITAASSDFRGDIILPPFGAIFYIAHLIGRQSKLEARHQALSQELPDAIHQAANFWQEHGASLLEKVQEAAEHVPVVLPEPVSNESFEQMTVRFEMSRSQAQAAHHRKTVLEELSQQIQIGQQQFALSLTRRL